jgi:uncharacterized protein (TIGR00251 family)
MQWIKIKVVPNARRNEIIIEGETVKVKVNAPAVDGKANKAVVECICKHFLLKKSEVEIIKGLKSREKTIQVNSEQKLIL